MLFILKFFQRLIFFLQQTSSLTYILPSAVKICLLNSIQLYKNAQGARECKNYVFIMSCSDTVGSTAAFEQERVFLCCPAMCIPPLGQWMLEKSTSPPQPCRGCTRKENGRIDVFTIILFLFIVLLHTSDLEKRSRETSSCSLPSVFSRL